MSISDYVNRMQTGNILLVVCCAFYLIWWSITFNPMKSFPMVPKVILFLCTFAAGVGGVLLTLKGMSGMTGAKGHISNIEIVIIGVILYFVLLFLTNHFMHREVTTELALIVGWTVLEICVMNSLYRGDILGTAPVIISIVIILMSAVIGLLCYLAYYNLERVTAFYVGMVPLILFAVVMLYETILIWRLV